MNKYPHSIQKDSPVCQVNSALQEINHRIKEVNQCYYGLAKHIFMMSFFSPPISNAAKVQLYTTCT